MVAHVTFVLTHRGVSALYGDEARVLRTLAPFWDALTRERRRYERLLVGLIRDAQARGEADAELDATLTARALLGMANAPLRWFHPQGRYRPEAIAAQHAALALGSLRP
jgi:hypothetical protein